MHYIIFPTSCPVFTKKNGTNSSFVFCQSFESKTHMSHPVTTPGSLVGLSKCIELLQTGNGKHSQSCLYPDKYRCMHNKNYFYK